MIKEFSVRALAQLMDELHAIDYQVGDPLEKMKSSLKPIRAALLKLRMLCVEHSFETEEDEVYFFKHIKPDFYCQQIFVIQRYTLERNMPDRDAEAQRLYLLAELAYVERFFLSHPLAYEYYRLGAAELDSEYFLRSSECNGVLVGDISDFDRTFSTPADYLFSQFRAYGLLKEWIFERLDYLSRNPAMAYVPGSEAVELKWTGDSVNLAELGYALVLSGQFNNGQAGVAQVFRWLEEKLSVAIGVPARRLASIRSRKRLSRTKFIDELKEGLERKLDQDDGR